MRLIAWMAGGAGIGLVLGALISGGEIVEKLKGGGDDRAFAYGMVFGYVVFGALLGVLVHIVRRRRKPR